MDLQEVQSRFPDGLPPLDPVDDMGIKDRGMTECVRVGHSLLFTFT